MYFYLYYYQPITMTSYFGKSDTAFGKSQTAFDKSQTAFGKSRFLLLSVFLFIWVFFSLPIVEVYDNSTTTTNNGYSYKCTNDNGKTYIIDNPNTTNKDINSENGYGCMRINDGIDPQSITFYPDGLRNFFSIIYESLPPTTDGNHRCIWYDDYGFLCDEELCEHLKNKNQSIHNLSKTIISQYTNIKF